LIDSAMTMIPMGIASRFRLNAPPRDTGRFLLDGQSVNEMIAAQLLPTLSLGIAAIAITVIAGIPLGMFTAVDFGYGLRNICNLFITLSLSMPIYWTGTLAILVFSAQLTALLKTAYC